MHLLRAFLGASAAGLLAALAWAWCAQRIDYDTDIGAWLVGIAVGLGATIAAHDRAARSTGLLAAGVALVCLWAGRGPLRHADLAGALGPRAAVAVTQAEPGDDALVVRLARLIALQRQLYDLPSQWPRGRNLDNAIALDDFPPDIARAATLQWQMMSDEEQQAYRAVAAERPGVQEASPDVLSLLVPEFTGLDLLWLGLALASAYRLALGGSHS